MLFFVLEKNSTMNLANQWKSFKYILNILRISSNIAKMHISTIFQLIIFIIHEKCSTASIWQYFFLPFKQIDTIIHKEPAGLCSCSSWSKCWKLLHEFLNRPEGKMWSVTTTRRNERTKIKLEL